MLADSWLRQSPGRAGGQEQWAKGDRDSLVGELRYKEGAWPCPAGHIAFLVKGHEVDTGDSSGKCADDD